MSSYLCITSYNYIMSMFCIIYRLSLYIYDKICHVRMFYAPQARRPSPPLPWRLTLSSVQPILLESSFSDFRALRSRV